MIFLHQAADYIRTGRAIKALRDLLSRKRPIIHFDTERDNRPPRYVAVVEAYRAGTPIRDIEARFGCSKGTVHRYARMAGLYRERETSPHDKIIAMLQLGKPYATIQATLGVSAGVISKIARANDLHRYKR